MINYFPLLSKEKETLNDDLTEQHLQIIWLEQKFLTSMTTLQNESIQVISPGVWNFGAGPDFLHAHLKIGLKDYRGSIEIHLEEQGWFQHGHHQDERYNNVILHVYYSKSAQPLYCYKENGQPLISCQIKTFLKHLPHELKNLIDFDLYPSKHHPEKGKCSQSIFQKLPQQKIETFLKSAAYWRFERKLNFLEAHYPDQSLQFLAGIALALGYKQNASAFMELFQYLLPMRDLPYEELFAIALGICGFLEDKRKETWEASSYYQELRTLWWGKRGEITHQVNLNLTQIRPLNHPMRRLSYLIHLMQDSKAEKLWSSALNVWKNREFSQKNKFRSLTKAIFSVFPKYQDSHWDFHYTFEENPRAHLLPMIGDGLKTHFMLNTYLPLLYSTLRTSGTEKDWIDFEAFYLSLETPHTSKTRYLQNRFFGEHLEDSFLNRAQMAQGAYQLHHDFCIHFESSCEGCPFVNRFFDNFTL